MQRGWEGMCNDTKLENNLNLSSSNIKLNWLHKEEHTFVRHIGHPFCPWYIQN